MGTRAHVVVTADPALESQLTDFAARELSLMERRWSRFLPTSELSRLNAAAGKPVIVSADTFSVITSAVDAWKQTLGGGAVCTSTRTKRRWMTACYAVFIDDNAEISEVGCLEELAA
ncbi:MAG TPA: FAD:protein FMN transferase [Acidimicrobiales bacterium]|nr:FAD:protein FMN transferase [Acidimicrobiales bacterium]